MKTFKTMMILAIMLSVQFSFGTGNETCCPDTSSVHLLASKTQQQLDQIQSESQIEIAKVPSLQSYVAKKLMKQQTMMDEVQVETQRLEGLLLPSLKKQLEVKLNSRVQDKETDEKSSLQVQF